MKSIAITILFIVCSARTFSQNANDLKSQQKTADDFFNRIERESRSFNDSIDRQFSEFLSEAWKQMDLLIDKDPDNKPKPETPPTAKANEKKVDMQVKYNTEISVEPQIVTAKDDFTGKVSEEFKLKLDDYLKTQPERRLIKYQGLSLNFFFDRNLDFDFYGAPDNSKIASAWEKLALNDYNIMIEQLAYYATRMKLNDWGMALMIKSAASEIFAGNNTKQNIFTWYLLNKMGYRLRLALDQSGVYLLVPSNLTVYGIRYVTFNNTRYYFLNLDQANQQPAAVLTYAKDYNPRGGIIDFIQPLSPKFGKFFKTRNFSFPSDGGLAQLEVVYDSSDVSYYNQFPFLDLKVVFANTLSDTALASIKAGLEPYFYGKTKLQKVNILLSFLQYGFQYKTDDDQFGRENYLYPEQSLYYPYNDCEDRSFLFSVLVKQVLNLKVIGLDFPGHVATAVRIEEPVEGDFVDYDGEKYAICDPTYIGACAGMCMPNYRLAPMNIIKIADLK